jgi:signal transduction histidine kinase
VDDGHLCNDIRSTRSVRDCGADACAARRRPDHRPVARRDGAGVAAEQACVRARQITWQLPTFSRGSVPIKKRVPIPRLLEESVTLALQGSNVRCTFDIAPDLWTVAADDGQLVQVFTNIVINAQQAMPYGGTMLIRAANVVETRRRWEYALRVSPAPSSRSRIRSKSSTRR